MEYVNRQGSNLLRKKLKIVSKSEDEMIVDIEHLDEGITKSGTPISAELFNTWQKLISDSFANSLSAVTTANKISEQPDCRDIGGTGEASVEIVDGKLKFNNLKGAPGEKYVVTQSPAGYWFYVNTTGELCLNSVAADAQKFFIQDGLLKYILE